MHVSVVIILVFITEVIVAFGGMTAAISSISLPAIPLAETPY
jgi:hypothetical protein